MANFSILAKLGMDSSPFNSALGRVGSKVKGAGVAIGGAMKAGFAVAAAAAAAFAVKSVSAFVEFEKKFTEVTTLLPNMTAGGFAKMQKDLREMATTMGVDLLDATQALYNAISAGIPEDNAVDFLADATKLAVAGVTDLQTAVSGLTTVLDAYNMDATEASKVSDILFATMQNGKTTIDELARNVGKVTPLASELGVSFEEVGAMFAVLTKKLGDGKTAEAGTQLKAMLAELGKEGSKAAAAFEKLAGVSFQKFIQQGGTVGEALKLLADEAERNGTGLQNMFGSIEAGMGALAVAANNGHALAGALESIRNGAGGTEEGFQKMQKTAARNFDMMKAQATESMMKLGEAFLPLVNQVLPMFSGLMSALPNLFSDAAGSGQILSATFDFIVQALKITIKVVASAVSGFASFGDILVWCGKMIAGFVAVFVEMGKTTFDPVIQVIMGVIDAFKALGDILSDPFDADNYEKAWNRIKGAGDKISKSVAGWGDKFKETFEKNKKFFDKTNEEFIKNMQKRNKDLRDIWGERGDFAFLAAKKGEAGAKDLNAALNNARANAAAVGGNLNPLGFNLRQAAKAIDRDLVRALARGDAAAGPLAMKMKEIQDRAKEVAKFWGDAAKDFAKVAKGKVELKMVGFKGNNPFDGFVRKMTDVEKQLRGGADRIAAIAPEAMKAVLDAMEHSGRKDARLLQVMYENAQRAQDQTVEGLKALDDELFSIMEAARQADVEVGHLNQQTKQYIKWLQTRRDIAEEGLQLQLMQLANMGKMGAKMNELQSLLGMIADLEGKEDAESIRLLKLHKEALLKVTKDLGIAVGEVKDEAGKLGMDPAQIQAVRDAEGLLDKIEAQKLTESEWLEKIHGILETMNGTLSNIAENLPNVKGQAKGELAKALESLNQQTTQEEVLDTLGGFFVNQ